MHNFESVASRHRRRSPLAPRNNLQIALDGQPIGRQPQEGHQLRDVQSLRYLTRLAIDVYGQRLAHQDSSIGRSIVRLGFRPGFDRAIDSAAWASIDSAVPRALRPPARG